MGDVSGRVPCVEGLFRVRLCRRARRSSKRTTVCVLGRVSSLVLAGLCSAAYCHCLSLALVGALPFRWGAVAGVVVATRGD